MVKEIRRMLREEGIRGWELEDATRRMVKEAKAKIAEYNRLLALEKTGVKVDPAKILECLL